MRRIPIIFFSVAVVVFAYAPTCFAATLSLPAQGPYSLGQTFSLPIYASASGGEAMNALSGTLSYPTDKLQLVSVNKTGIIDFWTQDPSTASGGSVTFEGGIYNPGFSGSDGVVATLTFKVLAAGTAQLSFSSAAILANDGQGTNILDSANGTAITLTGSAATPSAASTPDTSSSATGNPGGSGPTITSSTHPDQSQWYNTSTVDLSWTNPSSATAVRIGYDSSPSTLPAVVYTPPISHKELKLPDGVWYFRVQEKVAGVWGPASTFKIQIDTQPPVPINIVFPHGATTTDPRPIALFDTTDSLSGVAYYDVIVNGNGLVKVSSEDVKSNPYALPDQNPGVGDLKVIAYDQAGNSTTADANFDVLGLAAPTLDPVGNITAGDILQISGLAQPVARVDVYIKAADGTVSSQWVRSGITGSFRVIWNKPLSPGVYTVTAQATDDKGAKSNISQAFTFQVNQPSLLMFGWFTLNILSLVLVVISVIGALLFAAWYLWHRFHAVRHKILHKFDPPHRVLHREFDELRDAVMEEVAKLEKVRSRRELTVEEDAMIDRLTKIMNSSEEKLGKELDTALKSEGE